VKGVGRKWEVGGAPKITKNVRVEGLGGVSLGERGGGLGAG